MGNVISIPGWSSTDKVPGVGGETIFGAGAVSAASIPLTLLVVGTKLTAGSMVPNQDVLPVLSADDADAKAGAGSEGALMLYAAIAANPDATIYYAPPAEAGGASAATQAITLGGTWTGSGSWGYRFNGTTYTGGVASTDTTTTIAAAIAAAINANVRGPFTATSATNQVILTVKSKGARGNLYVSFQDTSQLPSGMTSVISGVTWTATQTWVTTPPSSYVVPTVANGFYYKCTVAGTGGSSQPTWPTTVGTTVTDGTATFTCWGQVLTGGLTTFGGGAGTEVNTTLLTVLAPTEYSRIANAESDATNLAAWKAQLDAQAGPTTNILEHLVTSTNGTLTAAEALAQTTLNDARFQILNQLNGETHPAIVAATFASIRCGAEQEDPDAAYDDQILTGVAPQAQKLDWPTHTVQEAALNNGVTPIYTSSDGFAKISRSIQTHCLTGSTPDYRVLDTGDSIVPDYIRRDISLYYLTVFKPANPRVQDNPPPNAKQPAAGIMTPDTWNTQVTAHLRSYERGDGFPAGIIINVDENLPQSGYDPVGKRIMTAIPCVPAPSNHQVGVSVRGQAA